MNPRRPPSAPDGSGEKRALDLSVPKIAGGALAAVTTAFAGSLFGVNGTITGAAFGSVVSTVAGALYAHSLTRAGTRIRTTRTLAVRPVAGTVSARSSVVADPADPTALPADLVGRSVTLPGETRLAPQGSAVPGRAAPRRRLAWKPLLALAVTVFVLTMAGISLLEGVLGHPVAASSQSGTTISRIVEGGGGARSGPPPAVTETPPSASDSPSASPSDATSTSPADSASATPSDSASPSGAVSGGPPTDTPVPTATDVLGDGTGANGSAGAVATQSPAG